MGNNTQKFEVRVAVRQKGSRHFSAHVGMFIEAQVTKMFHKDARTGEQAMKMCEKYGRPLSFHKVDGERMRGNAERFIMAEPKNPYPNAIAMDEFVWKKKEQRSERIVNRSKDKEENDA
jgi:hypothetical protein